MPIRPTTDKAALVDTTYHWRELDADTPRGVKLQLINRPANVAAYSTLGAPPWFWTRWAPLPTFAKGN